MTITTDTTLLQTRVVRRRCCTGRDFPCRRLRHVADETPDGAELETARRLGSVAPISRVEMSLEARLTQLISNRRKPAVISRKLTCWDAR